MFAGSGSTVTRIRLLITCLPTTLFYSFYTLDQEPPSPQARLKESLSKPEAFLKNYLEISELTMGTYKHIGRLRAARLVGKELSDLYM